ncbi:hypothetical protein Acsp02_59000 [Actinoplanes sp. NBRC 103695]|nr:hypothetical protein Acsp02_59000 [Actinoplanes sp. NBRC 103695]
MSGHPGAWHARNPAPGASGGSDGEQAPGRLARSQRNPAPGASGGSNGEQAPRRPATRRPATRPNPHAAVSAGSRGSYGKARRCEPSPDLHREVP